MFLFSAGPPITVDVNLNIRSMGPISEMDMVFILSLYCIPTVHILNLLFCFIAQYYYLYIITYLFFSYVA